MDGGRGSRFAGWPPEVLSLACSAARRPATAGRPDLRENALATPPQVGYVDASPPRRRETPRRHRTTPMFSAGHHVPPPHRARCQLPLGRLRGTGGARSDLLCTGDGGDTLNAGTDAETVYASLGAAASAVTTGAGSTCGWATAPPAPPAWGGGNCLTGINVVPADCNDPLACPGGPCVP